MVLQSRRLHIKTLIGDARTFLCFKPIRTHAASVAKTRLVVALLTARLESIDRMPITFVTASNNDDVLKNNFMASPCFTDNQNDEILVQHGFESAASAYNDAITRSRNDLIVFAHQDVLFPIWWIVSFDRALEALERTDPNWGVLGCYGETLNDNGRGYVYSPGRGFLGKSFDAPSLVQTLDEIVLIIRKSSGLRFDQTLPHFHFYGADICMAAKERGMHSYAISALCIHNSQQNLVLPREFYESWKHIRKRWYKLLPIQTTCARISRSNVHFYRRRLHDVYLRNIRHKEVGATRVEYGRDVLAELEQLIPDMATAEGQNGRCICP